MVVEYRDETPFSDDEHTTSEISRAIRSKKYGVDVREAIAQGIDKINDLAKGQSVGEIVATPTAIFKNLDELKNNYPNGADGVMVTVDNGHKYYYLNGKWEDGGIYQDNTAVKDIIDNLLSDIAHKDSDGKFKLNLDNTLTSETMPTSAKRVGELFKFNFRNYSKTYSWYDFKGNVPIIELQ